MITASKQVKNNHIGNSGNNDCYNNYSNSKNSGDDIKGGTPGPTSHDHLRSSPHPNDPASLPPPTPPHE